MFAQLGSTVFDGLKSFVSYSTTEEMAIAEFSLIGVKPRLMGAGVGLVSLSLSITLHAEFCNVPNELSKLQTAMETFAILPLLWGNGIKAGEWIIKEMPVEVVNMDKLGNIYEAKVNLTLLESVQDNKGLQAQQAAANNAFATGNKSPASKSKRKNATPCEKSIANLVSEINQFGGVINNIVPVYTGDPKQANIVVTSCASMEDDCRSITTAIKTAGSCVYGNSALLAAVNSVYTTSPPLRRDILANSIAVNNILPSTGPAPDGNQVFADNTALQAAIQSLVSAAQPIVKTAIIQ